jgi:hypothetical protein
VVTGASSVRETHAQTAGVTSASVDQESAA